MNIFTLKILTDEDLNLLFSRFGKIVSCEVIRDKRTNDSLQYAFIEFEHQKDCEQAYFKMQEVLIDDHRIHVDFSQSVRASLMFFVNVLNWRTGIQDFRPLENSNKFKTCQRRRWLRGRLEPREETSIQSCRI